MTDAARAVQFNLSGVLQILSEPPVGHALVTISYGAFSLTGRGEDMAFVLPIRHAVQCKVAYVDAAGNPANIDGAVVWDSSDEAVVKVTVDAVDSTRVSVEALDKTGQAQVTASADADLGAGVRELVTLMSVEVIAGEAVAGVISPIGDPTPVAP